LAKVGNIASLRPGAAEIPHECRFVNEDLLGEPSVQGGVHALHITTESGAERRGAPDYWSEKKYSDACR